GPGPKVLSICINRDPGQFPTPRDRRSEVVSLVDQAASRVEQEDEPDRKELRKDVQKLRAWLLEHPDWENGARGLAIFLSNARDLFEVFKVAAPVSTAVAARLLDLYKEGRVERLVIGCTEELLPRVLDHLHSYLRERFAGRVEVDIKTANADDVRKLAAAVLQGEDERREAELFERLRRELAVAGRAAYGLEGTLAALNEARV